MRFAFMCFLMVILCNMAGCSPTPKVDIQLARDITLKKDNFKESLRQGYIDLSDANRMKRDQRNARLYGKKALTVVRGHVPPLDDLTHRELPEVTLNVLAIERNFLVSAFAQNIHGHASDVAANARLMFDCWVEEEEKLFRNKGKKKTSQALSAQRKCKQGYLSSKAQIENILKQKKQQEEQEKKRMEQQRFRLESQGQHQLAAQMAAMQSKRRPKIMPQAYVVFFPFNRTTLSLEGKKILEKVAGESQVFNPVKVIISGHTDRVGGDQYNMLLSRKRAKVMASFLMDYGMPSELFDVRSYGENSLNIDTVDGKADPQNRYGKILFLRDYRTYYD